MNKRLPVEGKYRPPRLKRFALSLPELMAVIAILAGLAAIIIPRVANHTEDANRHACDTYQGEIELQVQLWRRNKGSFPAANLSDIGGDPDYFPDGLPVCPFDGTSYTIDTTTGTVIGHTH